MSTRPDISNKLVHFTSGENDEEAFQRLRSIVTQRRLIGTGEKIKGGYRCVCFSEAPLASLKDGLVNPDAYSRYSPFGILFQKRPIFGQGGRPVIYQTDEEYDLLPDELKWRHVRCEPDRDNKPIDFTWEREWRIQCDYLSFEPSVAGIVVPDDTWAQRLINEHEAEQDFKVLQYAQIMEEDLAQQYHEEFGWRIYRLKKHLVIY